MIIRRLTQFVVVVLTSLRFSKLKLRKVLQLVVVVVVISVVQHRKCVATRVL